MRDARDNASTTPLFRRHTHRPRLTALLDEATAQSILLTAPAGYGKTTLAREWLQGRDNVAWYRATSASADVGAFSVGLAEAVAPLVPGAGERVRQRLRVGDATERLARPLAELLSEDLDEWPDGGIVVLDDSHLLAESAPVEDFLDWLLTLAPIRVLVTSRRRPGWATARRFLHGEAVEIGRDQLAMTDEEAARVLEGRSGEAVRALVRHAEGWPAVIGLAALSADLAFPQEKVSESLYRYFADEVLRAEPPDVQRFMLTASVPVAIDARLAGEVLGFAEPEPLLAHLRDEDLLHEIPSGDLVFHPLIRDFLRRRHEADDPEGAEELTRQVIDDARERGRWGEAFELCIESGWIPEAADVVGQAARGLLAIGQNETLEKWLEACGAAGVTVPGAALARAELLIRKGEMSAAAALAEDTAARLSAQSPNLAWALNVAGHALHFTSNESAALERFEAAFHSAQTDDGIKDALWGLALTTTEVDPTRTDTCLNELATRYSDDLDVRLRLAVGHAAADDVRATLRGTWERFQALLPGVQYSKDPLAASTFLVSAASVAVLRAEYGEGRRLANQALRFCTDLRLDFAVGACHVYKAAAEIGLRLFPQARRSLAASARVGSWERDPYFHIEALNQRARLLAVQGAVEEAVATRSDLPELDMPLRPRDAYLGTLAILLAVLGETEEARETAAEARGSRNGIERAFSASLAEAIADDMDGRHSAFEKRAKELANEAAKTCYVDGLVFGFRLYPRLLEPTQHDSRSRAVAARALAQGHDFRLARSTGAEFSPELLDEPLELLTPREREVLSLLLEGMTDAQIATHLYISRGTAKVHVRHILAKLGVKTRLQAAVRAQELMSAET